MTHLFHNRLPVLEVEQGHFLCESPQLHRCEVLLKQRYLSELPMKAEELLDLVGVQWGVGSAVGCG
jgi:hypothetical protein